MAKWMRFTVEIPKMFGPNVRQSIAQDIIDFVVERTRSGKSVNNRTFPGYSPSYGKKGTPDLTLTGELLDELKLLTNKSGALIIGYDRGADINGKAEGNQLGTYGQSSPIPGKARPYLGISQSDLKEILRKYKQGDADAIAEDNLTASQAAGRLADGITFDPSDDE